MQKKFWTILLMVMLPMWLFGQSYTELWKKAVEAERKDLPQTQYQALQKIVDKAGKERAYGQLLKAELNAAQVMNVIAPDSLKPAVQRIQRRAEATQDEVLRLVYQTVLYRVISDNSDLELEAKRPELTPQLCEKLANIKEDDYVPFVIKGSDSRYFNHDLLSIVGYELDQLETLYHYYKQAGLREAACLVAADWKRYATIEELDALIAEYRDLKECGELAIARYERMFSCPVAERVAYIHEALMQWGSWKRINTLRNAEKELSNSQFHVSYDRQVVTPQQAQTVKLDCLRHLSSITMKVYRMDANGDLDASPSYDYGYQKVKKLIKGVAAEKTCVFTGKEPYEFFEDSLAIPALPVGVYMVEFTSAPVTEPVRQLYYVTDVYTIMEPQPETLRYVVVHASTGQPIAGAHLRITDKVYGQDQVTNAVADAKGEYLFKTKSPRHLHHVFAYTEDDKACPEMNANNQYSFYNGQDNVHRTCIYTDRSIYRPGQTVHAAVILYEVNKGMEHQVENNREVVFTLLDANGKKVAEKTTATDEYGTCAAELTIPSTGLSGMFRLRVNGQSHNIRVEEYKRPAFHVDFSEVKESYAAGDTLTVKGVAMSYAGVPVQDAKVSYRVIRRTAFWWWSYCRYWDTAELGYGHNGIEIYSGEAQTDASGRFEALLPFDMPETRYPMFYSFVVSADVTDIAGETHRGELSLPLGNRKQALSVDLPEKVLRDEHSQATFHLQNAAGKDMDASVRYRIDQGQWQTVKTQQPVAMTDKLKSGKHSLEAICQGDTLQRDFVVFSLDDTVPATETDDWFYQSAAQFPADGKPVTIQVGSSAPDVHIVYSIFAGEKVIESGAIERSNQLINLKLTYKEAYGNGLLLSYAWVKQGKCYTHTAKISRPLPDKKLKLQWTTFRDRLKPGQQEEWTLTVLDPKGKPVDAQLMATLYDQSLDQLQAHQWSLSPYYNLPMPNSNWGFPSRYPMSGSAFYNWKHDGVGELEFSKFDKDVYPSAYYRRHYFTRGAMMGSRMKMAKSSARRTNASAMMVEEAAVPMADAMEGKAVLFDSADTDANDSMAEVPQEEESVQVRENLNETAFFYPQLTTAADGSVALKFTLPESLTTWRLLGLAHTKDLCYGTIEGLSVAQKDVMIQPNVPRFLREGDAATIAARIFSTAEKDLTGTAVLRLINPETNAVVVEQKQPVTLKAGGTAPVTFNLDISSLLAAQSSLLICQMTVSGTGFSDGEQHYLPILPATEHVTVTVPVTQHHPGVTTVDLSKLVPVDATQPKLTVEYTNNPAWLMTQALSVVGTPDNDNAISLAAAYYANALGRHILQQNPQAKTVFQLWKQADDTSSLTSALEKNQELKDLLLNETPWVLDADNETEQKQRMGDFFDENLMQNRLRQSLDKLRTLQRNNGSWSWWPEMPGSFYMTVSISEMLVRLNAMTGEDKETAAMLSSAFKFMGKEIVEEVKEMKKWVKKGHKPTFPSFKALQWLYLATLDGRELPADVQAANAYLMPLLKKEIKNQSLFEKALTAVILSKTEPKRAAEYVQSLREYTVYREDIGRYYDTPRATYSWFDYKIPTQTVAIEAMQRLTPADTETISEMQRWLLQSKRTQAWDTPINSVNAVYAFLQGSNALAPQELSVLKVDGAPLELPKATAAIGYVKTNVEPASQKLTIEKASEGTSWGAVYAQFMQPTKSVEASGSGLTVTREIISKGEVKMGDRIKVRITITADRDYDFVQLIDRRAACMEPVRQLSGYTQGAYCTPKDCTTNYYIDMLSKGKHVIETEYYIDRTGTYETGLCTVGCAYAPEFRATAKSITITVK
jgi:uncharacterized protein YfaS (alpha-2-macroglobulin family)